MRFKLPLLVVLTMMCCAAFAEEPIKPYLYWCEDVDDVCYVKAVDVNTNAIINICPFDGYLIDGGTQSNVLYGAKGNAESDTWSIVSIQSDGSIEEVASLDAENVLRVLAYQENRIYYSKSFEGGCRYASVGENGEEYLYPPLDPDLGDCFCDVEADMGIFETDFPEDDAMHCWVYSTAISPDGKIAFCDTPDTYFDDYYEHIYYLAPDGDAVFVGEGYSPVWMDADTLLYVDMDHWLNVYDVKSKHNALYETPKHKAIQLPPIEGESPISISRNHEYISVVMYDWKGTLCAMVSLDSGKVTILKGIVPLYCRDRTCYRFGF